MKDYVFHIYMQNMRIRERSAVIIVMLMYLFQACERFEIDRQDQCLVQLLRLPFPFSYKTITR